MKTLQRWLLIGSLIMTSRAGAGEGLPGQIAGRVLDTSGKPVAEATVDCYEVPATDINSAGFASSRTGRMTTGVDGSFSLPLAGTPALLVVKKDGLSTEWKRIVAGDTDEVVTLRDPSALWGVVETAGGSPIAGAEVWVSIAAPARGVDVSRLGLRANSGLPDALRIGFSREQTIAGQPARDAFSVQTGIDGHFRITNFPPSSQADLCARLPGVGQSLRAGFGGTLTYASGQVGIRLVIDNPGTIEGKVLVEDGDVPMVGAKLEWLGPKGGNSESDAPAEAISGPDGSFLIPDVAFGRSTLRARGCWTAGRVLGVGRCDGFGWGRRGSERRAGEDG